MRPRVGHIQFINCFPLYYGLIEKKILLDVDLIKGTPAELNAMLRENVLDMAPISSIEYARRHRDLVLMPDISISADREVLSIILVSKVPVEELDGKRIALTNTSATSQVLLKVLLAQKYGINPQYFESPPHLGAMLMEAEAALLIGDHALRESYLNQPRLYTCDLGREWNDFTGHSMVFAVWAVRREYASQNAKKVAMLKNAFLESMAFSLENIKAVAGKIAEWEDFAPEYLENYFSRLRFDFGTRQQAGLLAYYRAAARMGLLAEVPSLNFLEV